jgi:hypothetical protein
MSLCHRLSLSSRILNFSAGLALLASLLIFALTSRELSAAGKAQAASIEVLAQAGVPLAITSIVSSTSDPKQPTFTYEVVNSSDKPVSAYAIRYDVTVGASQTSGAAFTTLWSANSLLQPQARSAEDFQNTTYGAAVSKVILSVDFVEFADGNTWGADTFKMSEKLAGARAGGSAALEQLRGEAKARGLKSVADLIDKEIKLTPQTDKTETWKEGFEEGVRSVRARLQHAKRKGGLSTLESELFQPFDVSEGRRQP